MKILLFTISLIVAFFTFSQNGASQCNADLIGKWTTSDYGYEAILVFDPNGTCEMDGMTMNYSCNGENLSIITNGKTETFVYTINSNVLSMEDAVSGLTITMKKDLGVQTQSKPKHAVENGQNIPPVQAKNDLIGIWIGYNERIEFKENGSCIYNGQALSYETNNSSLTLITTGGNVTFNYILTKDQLTLKADGKTLVYSREGSQVANTKEIGGTKRIAQELVGKWCWTNVTTTNTGGSTSEKCIVLNADGTYTYNAERSMDTNTDAFYAGSTSQSNDFGTWTYDGTRIYYTSQNGQGTGSYLLEKRNHPKNGDPMIVLDGETYVTYYQKNPW